MVGDICGIISGSASAIIAGNVIVNFTPTGGNLFTLFLSATVSAVTIGGKAIGKTFAINASTSIVHLTAGVIYRFRSFFKWLRTRGRNS